MNENLKLAFFSMMAFLILVFYIFISIYAWSHPEKTNRQITIDLWNGKVVRYFSK
jgi:hypothetical protein